MIFGPTPLAEARGAVLAHTLRLPAQGPGTVSVLKKGTVLDAAVLDAIAAAGITEIIAARLEPGDVPENEAAHRLAEALLRPGITRSAAATGRVNLFAAAAGVLEVDAALVDRINALDESLTLATLPPLAPVRAGEMLATVKVIPFAVPGTVLRQAETLASSGGATVLHPFRPLRVGLVLSTLPGMKEGVLANGVNATRARLDLIGGTLLPPERTMHDTDAISAALDRLRRAGADMLLVLGASAVVDRRDVGPAAIIRSGGDIEHFGMPVDPGNLLCLGRVGDVPALVLPGCARSPKLNGFDWVLQRLAAGISVSGRDLMRMGAGGLLTEIPTRPLPRAEAATAAPSIPADGAPPSGSPRQPPAPVAEPVAAPASPLASRSIAAVVLAAGRSSRMGARNKLLIPDASGVPMVARAVDNALLSGAASVVLVTGHDAEPVRRAVAGRPVRIVHAPHHAEGLSASLRAGLDALSSDLEGVLVCLGDMPLVSGDAMARLIGAFDPGAGRSIVLPTWRRARGNPVLWARSWFPALRALTGDRGARDLLAHCAGHVVEVPMDDDAVLRDFDTPESLHELAPTATG